MFIVETPARQFIFDNLPSTNGQAYMPLQQTGGLASAARVLVRIAVEHPYDFGRGWLTKLGFSLGWLPLMGGSAHPELVAASAGYLFALLLLPSARAFITWPVHAFVVSHLGWHGAEDAVLVRLSIDSSAVHCSSRMFACACSPPPRAGRLPSPESGPHDADAGCCLRSRPSCWRPGPPSSLCSVPICSCTAAPNDRRD